MAIASPTSIPAETGDEQATETDSARRAGGPQDHALYQCSCGMVFTAAVSTSVGCPVCGSDQAW
jgi:hypothetical protein